MVQIKSTDTEQKQEILTLKVDDPVFDFNAAKQLAKETASEKCENSMILSWKNGKTGESYPNYECGISDKPFWIRYAEGRGANLTIDINDGDYVFMVLKM